MSDLFPAPTLTPPAAKHVVKTWCQQTFGAQAVALFLSDEAIETLLARLNVPPAPMP